MRTTAQEILADFAGETLHCFVTGTGTGGTLLGVGRVLRQTDPHIRIVVAEPDNAPILASGIPQPRDATGKASRSHPHFQPHLIQGWTPDFIPRLTETARDEKLVDEIVPIAGNEALRLARELATREGIFAGPSSGATLAARARRRATQRRPAPTSSACCPTRASATCRRRCSNTSAKRWTTTKSRSRVRRRAIASIAPACAVPAPAQAPSRWTNRSTRAPKPSSPMSCATNPSSCSRWSGANSAGRCASCSRALGIAYESVDLDSVAFQQDDLGVKIRAVLRAKFAPTIPQIFIGGERIGGCTDLFDAMRSGEMQRRLDAAGVAYDRKIALDPYTLLPNWVHPREPA